MSKGTTVLNLATKAKETFDRNIDTMIAAFLIRNPDVDPGDIELVFTPSTDGTMHFRINSCPRGILLPERKEHTNNPGDGEVMNAHNHGHMQGWNACREAVISLNAHRPEQLRSPMPGTPMDVESKVVVDG